MLRIYSLFGTGPIILCMLTTYKTLSGYAQKLKNIMGIFRTPFCHSGCFYSSLM